ncbi:MAG: RluA family pseudouridine synthase [Pseudomonadota bacterium]
MKSLELHLVVSDNSIPAVDYIKQQSTLSKGLIKKIMSAGAVWLSRKNSTGRLRRATKALLKGDEVHLYYKQHIIDLIPQDCQLIADEGDYSVWNKPAGTYSQGTRYGDHCTVQRYAEKHLKPQRNAFIVHRLDKDANGIILLAHSKNAATLLSSLFKNRNIQKTYKLLVEGHLQVDTLPYKINQAIDGKTSISIINTIRYQKETDQTKLEVSIETGRKHQIRKHMAFLGHPIVGDPLYASPESIIKNLNIKLQLSAWKLSFNSPFNNQPKTYQLKTLIIKT